MKCRPILNRYFVYSLVVVLSLFGLAGCRKSKAPPPQPNAALPDLVFESVKPSRTFKGLNNATGFLFVFTVKNQGPVDAPGSTTSVRFEGGSDGGQWSYGPVELTTFHLSAGTSDTLETPIPLPQCIPLCFFTIEVDSNHQVDESDKTNNKES